MYDTTACGNCGTKYKNNVMSPVKPLGQKEISIINYYELDAKDTYCTKCGYDLYERARVRVSRELTNAKEEVSLLMQYLPIISVHTPLNWNYMVIKLVTGQSVTGTGVLTEFSSSLTDFFGQQSSRYNKKLKDGENLCLYQIGTETLRAGGNAIIGVNINYSEVGGGKGMLMVCMTGTAVLLYNTDVLPAGHDIKIKEAYEQSKKVNELTVLLQDAPLIYN